MKKFYTVLVHRKGYPVSYLGTDTSTVNELAGPFGDPGEASQEFKARIGGEQSCYLQPAQFTRKVNAIRDMQAKRAEWDKLSEEVHKTA